MRRVSMSRCCIYANHHVLSITPASAFQCKCIDAPATKPAPACKFPGYKADTRCDDENNKKSCDWDGGDCCLQTVQSGKVDSTYCTEVGCE